MKRVATALILIPLFAYIVVWAPQILFVAATAAVALAGFYEYSNLAGRHGIQAPGFFGYIAGLLWLLLPQSDPALLVLIAILSMALSLRSGQISAALPAAAVLVLGVLYIFGSLRFVIELRAISVYWALFALSLNWVGDIAALYVGRAIGRHKLAPRVSPAKSIEGSAASVVASMIYAGIYFPRLLPHAPVPEALLIAAVANAAGQAGDLCESALKRGAGVKDSGSFLPGHGGWLDRIDSSLFALPVVYVLARALHLT